MLTGLATSFLPHPVLQYGGTPKRDTKIRQPPPTAELVGPPVFVVDFLLALTAIVQLCDRTAC